MTNKVGIYCIKCYITKKVYIGSSQNLYKRKGQHFSLLKNNKHPNILLQRLYNKYNSLSFTIIEECSVLDLIKREQFYIDNNINKINFRLIAESNKGWKMAEKSKQLISSKLKGRKLTFEQCQEISIRNSMLLKGRKLSKEHVESIRQARTGCKLSNSTKEKIRQKAIGRDLGKKLSDETKRKIGIAFSKKVYQYDIDNNFIQEFISSSEAGRVLNINNSSISSCCRNKRKTAGNFKWYYEKQN